MDWLAEKALDAIKTETNENWVADKAHMLKNKERMDVLRWICSGLDSKNKYKVCQALDIDPDDLEAVERVLKAI